MALNLRKISPELHRNLKSAAAVKGKTIEDYCLDILERHMASTVALREQFAAMELPRRSNAFTGFANAIDAACAAVERKA